METDSGVKSSPTCLKPTGILQMSDAGSPVTEVYNLCQLSIFVPLMRGHMLPSNQKGQNHLLGRSQRTTPYTQVHMLGRQLRVKSVLNKRMNITVHTRFSV